MRRIVVLIVVIVMVGGGCWIYSEHQPETDTRESMDEREETDDGDDEVAGEEPAEPEPPQRDPALPTVDGPHYEAFDMLRNRPLAHRTSRNEQGRSVWVDGASFDFARYILGNHQSDWIVDAELEDESTVAATSGRSARLSVPAFEEEAQVLVMRIFSAARGHNRLDIGLNGEPLEAVELEEGWQTVEFDIGDVAETNNDIEVEFNNLGRIEGSLSGGGIDWIRLGPDARSDQEQGAETEDSDAETEDSEGGTEDSDAETEDSEGGTEDSDAETEDSDVETEDSDADIVGQGPHQRIAEQEESMTVDDGGLMWNLWLHDDAVLELEIEAAPGCGVRVDADVETGDGAVENVERRDIELVEERGEVQTTAVDFDIDTSQVVRMTIDGVDADDCEPAELHVARLLRPGAVDGVPEEIEPPEHVIFWVIDTLRADYLPLHFDTDVEAPNLQRLADGGVSFETAYVQGTESRASHASLFTGNYPDRHGVMAGGTVDPGLPIIPHFFGDAGYRTGNLSANGYVSHLLNLDRGWDHFRNLIHEETSLDAEFLVEYGLEWLEEQGGEPSFLYLGTIDPHATYRRHDEFIELYEPADYQGRFRRHLTGHQLEDIKAGTKTVTERERERIINLYKNEITYNDAAFGKLREELEEMGIWDDTLVVVTSDHGEEFWEHGSVGHGHNVHQEMVHVPLLFHYPGELPEGRTMRTGGEVIDIAPTIRDMLGQEPLEDRQGRSLVPLMFGEHGGYPAPVIATQYQLEYGIQIRDWKLYLGRSGVDLYDRASDPLEESDVQDDHPLANRWLRDSLGWFRAHREEWDKSQWGVTNRISDQFLELVER